VRHGFRPEEDDIDEDVIEMNAPRKRPRVLHRKPGEPLPPKPFFRGGSKAALLRYAKYLPVGSSLLFGPLPGILQSYALRKMKPHFLAKVRQTLISKYHYSAAKADQLLTDWADSITVVKNSAVGTAKEIIRAETGEVGQTLLRDPSRKKPMKKKSATRISKFPIKHSDGTTDRRYTVTKEYAGSAAPLWVARFQGEWIASAHTREGAISHATQIWGHRQRSLTGARDPKKKSKAVMRLAAKYAKARSERLAKHGTRRDPVRKMPLHEKRQFRKIVKGASDRQLWNMRGYTKEDDFQEGLEIVEDEMRTRGLAVPGDDYGY
jgi:hypothetical protein